MKSNNTEKVDTCVNMKEIFGSIYRDCSNMLTIMCRIICEVLVRKRNL